MVNDFPALSKQVAVLSSISTKIRLSILATALSDALGGPAEFHPRFEFPPVYEMIPNETFRLPRGVWTDDTSMTLCLARSIATFVANPADTTTLGGFDELDQLRLYYEWAKNGYLSAVGACFDIGTTTRTAVMTYSRIIKKYDASNLSHEELRSEVLSQVQKLLGSEDKAGNGSLMRLLPIPLAYHSNADKVKAYAIRSSQTTHPCDLCVEVCKVWADLLGWVLREITKASHTSSLSKLDVLKYIANRSYTHDGLSAALKVPPSASSLKRGTDEEEWYRKWHPIMKIVSAWQKGEYKLASRKSPLRQVALSTFWAKSTSSKEPGISAESLPRLPPPSVLSSSGFVLETLVCALFCFLATTTFEMGAIVAANMGSDADTVAAIYGGLAGIWYSREEDQQEHSDIFWSPRVKRWRDDLVEKDLLTEVADELVEYVEKLHAGSVPF